MTDATMPAASGAGGYPSQFGAGDDPSIANWRPLAHWLLVIPQSIVAGLLGYVAGVVALVTWFIVLFTGKMPEGIGDFQAMVLRYTSRTYAYSLGLTEQYPPFNFDSVAADPGGHDTTYDLRPDLEDRNRLTVFFRLIMLIPLMFVAIIYMIGMFFIGAIAWFAVLFTGTYPVGLRLVMIGLLDWYMAIQAYGNLLVDEYPPFGLSNT